MAEQEQDEMPELEPAGMLAGEIEGGNVQRDSVSAKTADILKDGASAGNIHFPLSEARSARWCQIWPKINISILYCTVPVEINPETGGRNWESAKGGANREFAQKPYEPSDGFF
ncbi:hypothetical protein B0H10DRAFT_2194733, partial [Mycena sp. CBHHK59/15]